MKPARNGRSTLAVVLAGGESRRFGSPKTKAMLAGRALIRHVIDRLAAMGLPVAVNAADATLLPSDLDLPIFDDRRPDRIGPAGGILAALDEAALLGYEAVLTVPADSPLLPDDLLAQLAKTGGPAIAASGGRVHPVVGLWPVSLAPTLRGLVDTEGLRRVGVIAERLGARIVEWPATPFDPFLDVDEPADLMTAEAALRARLERKV